MTKVIELILFQMMMIQPSIQQLFQTFIQPVAQPLLDLTMNKIFLITTMDHMETIRNVSHNIFFLVFIFYSILYNISAYPQMIVNCALDDNIGSFDGFGQNIPLKELCLPQPMKKCRRKKQESCGITFKSLPGK